MKEILKLLNEFEDRNNISVYIEFHSDGSGGLYEFWKEDLICDFSDENEVSEFLSCAMFEKDKDGLCLFPFVRVENDFVIHDFDKKNRNVYGSFRNFDFSFDVDVNEVPSFRNGEFHRNDDPYLVANHVQKDLESILKEKIVELHQFQELLEKEKWDEDEYIQFCKEEERNGN